MLQDDRKGRPAKAKTKMLNATNFGVLVLDLRVVVLVC